MASGSTRPNGHQWVFFRFRGKRHTVRLGSISVKDRREFERRVDRLVDTVQSGLLPDAEQRSWLRGLAPQPHKVLVNAGLSDDRGPRTIGELFAWHRAALSSKGRKLATLEHFDRVADRCAEYLGAGQLIGHVRPIDADRLKEAMIVSGRRDGAGLAATTVSREVARMAEVFETAVKQGWIPANPFGHIPREGEVNHARDEYVPWDLIERLLEHEPNREFRFLLALARVAGLRVPSEMQDLRWESMLWDLGLIHVVAHKTKARDVPMFASLRAPLDELWDAAGEGPLVFPGLQVTNTALTNRLERLCRRSGVALWAKPWVNMRASAERDLLKSMPIDQAAAILGHSPETALRHYNRVAKELRAVAEGRALRTPDHSWEVKPNAKRPILSVPVRGGQE